MQRSPSTPLSLRYKREFVRVLSANEIEFRIYERGVGPTHSSGTGHALPRLPLSHCRASNVNLAQPRSEDVSALSGPRTKRRCC